MLEIVIFDKKMIRYILRRPARDAWSLFTVITAILLSVAGCSPSDPIKIGMIAGFTGSSAKMGIAGRDGALLALEEINRGGGLKGRELILVVRDDKQNKVEAQRAVTELIDEEVAGVIGPMTSAMGVVVAAEINRHQIPTVSPTVSTHLLAGQDDFFFRIIPVSTKIAEITAKYVHDHLGIKSLLVVYDLENDAYTEPWYHALRNSFATYGGARIDGIGFRSTSGFDFHGLALQLIERAEAVAAEGLVILASGIDTALICQSYARLGGDKALFASEWSMSEDLIEYGGSAVEGLRAFHSFDPNGTEQPYIDFSLNFQQRYGYTPGFASAYGYLAMHILIDALGKADAAVQVKEAILAGSPYPGLQQKVRFDRYGDALRKYTLLRVSDGKRKTMERYGHW